MTIHSRILRPRLQTACALLLCAVSAALAEPAVTPAGSDGFLWKSEVPADCPFEPSQTLTGVFFTGRHSDYQCGDTFYPSWASDGNQIKPLIEWNNHMGCVTATYVPGLKKYLMCVTDGWPTVATMDSYILEADEITGPWRMVKYMKNFGEQAYFLNFPSKFIRDDGRTLWLCYSANFSQGWNGLDLKINPPGGRYGLSLHELKLLGPNTRQLPVKP